MDAQMTDGYRVGLILPEDTWGLRAEVLWPEKAPDSTCVLDSDEVEGAFHVGVTSQGRILSTASFFPQSHDGLEEYVDHRLRAMATHPDHRGRGLGKRVVEFGIARLAEVGAGGVWADARHVALGFYARLDWEVTGPTYEVRFRGLHRLVWRRIDAVINR